jgi:hypothetical protein
MAGTVDCYAEHEHQRQERGAALEHLFYAELERAKVEGHWIIPTGYANGAIPPYARLA